MPSKLQFCKELAEQILLRITGSYQTWTGFLVAAARLYKYPFHEQLMIYAQRPEATACAEYDLWNYTMRRCVRRGSQGIALIDTSGDNPRLRYVFDVSDTGGGERSRRPFLWEYRDEHFSAVTAALEQRYDVQANTRAKKLADRMLNELIQKIEVHQSEKVNGVWEQHLTIHYNCIGVFDIPDCLEIPCPEVSVNTRKGVVVSYLPNANPAECIV